MKILELDHISKFICDGTTCVNNCCKRDWYIQIDDAILSKYKHIKPAAKSKEITKHIKKKRHPLKGVINMLILNEEHQCPFLDADNLCGIQKNYGENYLSLICKTYPRMNFKITKDAIFRTLSLTCPTACHLLLNLPRTSDFTVYESSEAKNWGIIDLSNAYKSYALPTLNVTNYSILRSQDLTLDERLAIVALFSESANDAKNLNELTNISGIFVKDAIKNAREILSPLTFNSENFLKEIFAFIKVLFTEKAKTSDAQAYVKFINDVFEISVLEDDINELDFDKPIKIYEEKFLPAKNELFKINDLQIENFAINYLFMTGLPVNREVKDFRKNIAKFLIEYKTAEFMFVCFYASMKESWNEIAIELVAEDIANCFEHNLFVKKAIDDKFKNMESVMSTIQLLLDV